MSAVPKDETQVTQHREDGFDVVGLANSFVAVEVVPALGGRLLSLRNVRTGREWLWRAADQRGLFSCPLGTPFEDSPLAGVDECLPTIVPCKYEGRNLPDHGECWTQAWSLDAPALASGKLHALLDLPISPLRLERTICLRQSTVSLDYAFFNLSDCPQSWLYAFHALFPIEPDDRIVLPGQVVAPSCPEGEYAKQFYPAKGEGQACLYRANGESLEMQWKSDYLPWLAVWITKGAWHGHRHLALEPTNAPEDDLLGNVPYISAKGCCKWSIELRLIG